MFFPLMRSLRTLFTHANFFKEISSSVKCNYMYDKLLLKQINCRNNYFDYCPVALYSSINPMVESAKIAPPDKDLQEFNNSYEVFRKSVLCTNDKVVTDALNWSVKALDYNIQGGKKNRGVTVLKGYKILSEDNISSDGRLQACILGWCVEMFQAFLLVCDDIMDNSEMRRGKPCWYKKPNVGLTAVNDGLLFQSNIYKILEIYFSKTEAYNNIQQEFLKITQNTIYGQCLDMLYSLPGQKRQFDNFTVEKYEAVVKYKTSYYSFCLPVHLAMHHVGKFSTEDFQATEDICFKLGLLFQIQDDYLDAFGDPEVTGKIGRDIVEGKCTWFAATFFEYAPDAMKAIMKENYGIDNKDSVSQVMKLYEEFNIKEKFHESEEQLIQDITSLINNNLTRKPMQALFHSLLQTVYKRKK